MTFAILAVRDGNNFTQVFGPVEEAEAVKEFKARAAADAAAKHDGQLHGILGLYLLVNPRTQKLKAVTDVEPPPPKSAKEVELNVEPRMPPHRGQGHERGHVGQGRK